MLAPLLKSVTGREALKRHDELFSMCKEAGNLAYKLWSQKARITVAKFSRNNKHFNIESPFMQPHASMLCDYDSHEYDGIAVQLCIEPAIIAYGNERGQEYDDYKIWAPAIVWIAKEMAATSSSRPSVADRLTNTVDVQTKLDPDLEEADFKEDAMGERPTKKVRLSQPVSPTLAASVGAGPYTKQYREGQGLENLKTELNSLPALSMTNTICYEYSASKSSAGDTASLTNSLEKRRDSAKNNSGTARLQEENRSNCSGRNISLASTKPDVELGKNRRDYRADEAGIQKMSQFERALAQACSRETTYERELKFRKPQPAEPRPMDKSTTTDRDFVLGCDRSDLT